MFRSIISAIGMAGAVSVTAGAAAALFMSQFAELVFSGLIGNMPLNSLTQQQIRNALARQGLRQAHDPNHNFVQRLVERGAKAGIRTLNDFARAIRGGTAVPSRPGFTRGTVAIILQNGEWAVIVNEVGELITLVPW
jgi:hypothetical protein